MCRDRIWGFIWGRLRLRPAHEARLRGATPRPRSGAEAGRTPCPKGGGQEELPYVRGQGQRPRVPGWDGAGTAESSYPSPRSGTAARGATLRPKWGQRSRGDTREQGQGQRPAGRSYPTPQRPRPGAEAWRTNPMPEARGGGWEDQPHVQGAVSAGAQEGLEELSHVEGQEGRRWGDIPRPR